MRSTCAILIIIVLFSVLPVSAWSENSQLIKYDLKNGSFYKKIFKEITAGKSEDEDIMEALNRYVVGKRKTKSKLSFAITSPRQIIEIEEPHSYTCGELSLLMATLAFAGNYKVRCIDMIAYTELSRKPYTHVVVEVFYKNRWHLYDPTYGISYRNSNREVANYEDIRSDLTLLNDPRWLINPRDLPEWMMLVFNSGNCVFYLLSY